MFAQTVSVSCRVLDANNQCARKQHLWFKADSLCLLAFIIRWQTGTTSLIVQPSQLMVGLAVKGVRDRLAPLRERGLIVVRARLVV